MYNEILKITVVAIVGVFSLCCLLLWQKKRSVNQLQFFVVVSQYCTLPLISDMALVWITQKQLLPLQCWWTIQIIAENFTFWVAAAKLLTAQKLYFSAAVIIVPHAIQHPIFIARVEDLSKAVCAGAAVWLSRRPKLSLPRGAVRPHPKVFVF